MEVPVPCEELRHTALQAKGGDVGIMDEIAPGAPLLQDLGHDGGVTGRFPQEAEGGRAKDPGQVRKGPIHGDHAGLLPGFPTLQVELIPSWALPALETVPQELVGQVLHAAANGALPFTHYIE
jgi:hypothetical protein